MMTPLSQTLFFASASLSILLLHFFQTCDANCIPSACGTITNISYPFRLKGDPKKCGDSRFELACEKDVASLSLNSKRYYVKEINYHNHTIRLADASVNNRACSFPTNSAYAFNFTYPYAYPYLVQTNYSSRYPFDYLPLHINLMSCPYPLKNPSLFTQNFTHCAAAYSDSSQPRPRYSYIKLGHIEASEVPEMCGVDVIVMTSLQFKDLNNASLSEIHQSLLYGFDLIFCTSCRKSFSAWDYLVAKADLKTSSTVRIYSQTPSRGNLHLFTISVNFLLYTANRVYLHAACLLILLVVVGVTFAIFCPLSVIGILVVSALVLLALNRLLDITYVIYPFYLLGQGVAQLTIDKGMYDHAWILKILFFFHLLMEVCVILAPRFLIFPLALWFLIYKFRRRHLSMYNNIESFLQSDNKLAPIRYSYSDIKKMTRSFKDKLGEGGYGSVYKGKLRSGRDIAVKLLRESRAHGQDFINEISTIGRIHHVNIIKLVGYCAEGSKRALIFDFMPNGSLETYLFNREKENFLNLERKFEIVVGVARGIDYLHRGCDVQILHFDIKPHNVLLDDKFVPKISDFGLAKFCSTDKNTVTMTAARGTIGYVAPELISRSIGAVSYKADVYSFGMLLMEIVSLKKDLTRDDSNLYFPYWIYECFNQGKDIEIKNDDNDDSTRRLARKITIVALWCIQMCPNDCPSMHKVLEMLESDVERLELPNYPSQSTQNLLNMDQSGSTYSTDLVASLSYDDSSSRVEITVQK